MMIGDRFMRDAITKGDWKAYRDGNQIWASDLVIGTNSIDVTLGRRFIWLRQAAAASPIDPYDPMSVSVCEREQDVIVLKPGETVLGHTRERFETGNSLVVTNGGTYRIAPMYDGRSTCGRLFLASHITAGYGDVGFNSCWTLELKNMSECNSLVLHAGMRIGQVSFHLVVGGGEATYHGAYVEQHDRPKPPTLGADRF